MSQLADKKCVPCQGGVEPLKGEALGKLADQVDGWSVVEQQHIEKVFGFPDFATALEFVNAIGAIAEGENHHPDLTLSWGKVGAKVWTHDIGGLSENDFVLAAKIDRAYAQRH